MLDRQRAIDLALEATRGIVEVPDDASVEVEETDNTFVVRFLAALPSGVRGPDFHARVTLDAETGEALEVVAGS